MVVKTPKTPKKTVTKKPVDKKEVTPVTTKQETASTTEKIIKEVEKEIIEVVTAVEDTAKSISNNKEVKQIEELSASYITRIFKKLKFW